MNDWLSKLKVGDRVCYHDRYHGYVFETIERITPTKQIKTKHYTFKDGYCRGSSAWDEGKRLQPITGKVLDEVRKRQLQREIKEFRFEKLSLQQLERVSEIIHELDLPKAVETNESPSAAAAEEDL